MRRRSSSTRALVSKSSGGARVTTSTPERMRSSWKHVWVVKRHGRWRGTAPRAPEFVLQRASLLAEPPIPQGDTDDATTLTWRARPDGGFDRARRGLRRTDELQDALQPVARHVQDG